MRIIWIYLMLLAPVTVYGDCKPIEYAELKDMDIKTLSEKSAQYLSYSEQTTKLAKINIDAGVIARGERLIAESMSCLAEYRRVEAIRIKKGGKP